MSEEQVAKNDEGKENTDITGQQQNMADENPNDSSNNSAEEPLKPKAVATHKIQKTGVDDNDKDQDSEPQKKNQEEDSTAAAAGSSPTKKRKHDDKGESAKDDGAEENSERTNKEATTDDEEKNPEEESDTKPKAVPFDLTQPIKRARTGYFIFADDHRNAIQAKHKGEGVAVVARELGQMWATLDPEEKENYQEKAALERERVAKQMEQLKEAGVDLSTLPGAAQPKNDSSNTNALIFPFARIRKICKLDPEVRNLSKEALLLVTKCTELATAKLGMETVRVAQIQNRRKLLPEDIAQVCATREQFLFLNDDVKDLVREQVAQKQKQPSSAEGGEQKQTNQKAAAAASNTKPLTAFFSAK